MIGLLETPQSNLRQLVAGLSTQRSEFVYRPVHAKLIVDDVELGKVYIRIRRFLLVGIIPPMLHIHSFTCHQRYIL
jgi:hypothetical protein